MLILDIFQQKLFQKEVGWTEKQTDFFFLYPRFGNYFLPFEISP